MSVKQLSVFSENKHGSLYEVTEILSEAGINIRAFSVADTEKYGVIRMIVSDARKAAAALSENDKIVRPTDVVAVKVSDTAGGLSSLLGVLAANNVNLDYLYAFVANDDGCANVVLRVADNEFTEKILVSAGFTLLTDDDIKK